MLTMFSRKRRGPADATSHTTKPLRFIVRFTNGYWKVFDSFQFKEVDLFDTEREAQEAAASWNRPQRAA